MVLAIGVILFAAGLVLILNVAGAGDLVMRRVTSQPLGELAPGFAASRGGFKTYAALVLAIGVFAVGLGVAGWSALIGAGLMGLGGIAFVVASVIAIAGEVKTYRALKR
ncbi:MAG TPA: hypothetical protein VF956_05210 [Candidatus Dormibacteraeota bacterium]